MNYLFLQRTFPEDGCLGTHPTPEDVTYTLTESTTVVAPDGATPLVFRAGAIPTNLHETAHGLWSPRVKSPLSNRSSVVGCPREYRGTRLTMPKEEARASRLRGEAQAVLGFLDKTGPTPAHEAPLSRKHPELLRETRPLLELVANIYREHFPVEYATQLSEVEEAPDFHIPGTPFSTVYLVKQLRCAYHRDAGNLRGVRSAIMPMGNFTGGELVLKKLGVAVAMKPGDLLLFDPQLVHGNLPFQGERMSAVFYCEARIAQAQGGVPRAA